MYYKIVPTDKGPMAFAWRNETVISVLLPFRSIKNLQLYISKHWSHYDIQQKSNEAWLIRLEKQFDRYFKGEPVDFSWVSVEAPGTEFKQKVYESLRKLKTGETISYEQLGVRAGRPNCGRAVGTFMSSNPTPLLIPCHRVLPANGKLGAFSAEGGIQMKLWMLESEGAEARI